MTTAFSNLLGLALPVTGELSGTWGDTVNDYITKYLDDAIANAQIISGSQTAVTLSKTTGSALVSAGSGATGSAQYALIRCTGNPASTLTITVSYSSLTNAQFSKTYLIFNSTSTNQSVVVQATTSSGTSTGVTITSGEKALIAWNGTDFVKIATQSGTGEFVTVDTTNLEVTNIKAKDGTASIVLTDSTGAVDMSKAVTMSATTQNIALGTSQTSGTFTVGGAAQTGAITVDQSTKAHTLNIATGATESATTKTINVGTAGVSGSTTTMSIGSAVAGSATNLTVNAATTFTPIARNTGALSYFTVTTPADTLLTASTEVVGSNFTAATRQWATGALTLQRERVFAAPTYAFDGASTLTTAVNVDIAAPVAGTNATITTAYALRAAASEFTGNVTLSGGTANGVPYLSSPGKVLTTGSALTFDGTNLGLSSSSVAAAVKIDGSGRYKQFETYQSGAREFYVGYDSTSLIGLIYQDNNRPIAFGISGSETMRLTSTGLKASIAGTNADPVFSYTSDTNTGIFFPAADKLGFVAGGGSDQMVLTTTGLGIGTSSPAVKLDVRGSNSNNLSDLTAQLVNSVDTTAYAQNNGSGISFGYVFNSGGSVIDRAAVIKAVKENSTDGNYATSLVFANAANSANTIEKMRLDSSGNLGLGVTPSAWWSGMKALQVGSGAALYDFGSSNVALGSNLYFDGSNSLYINSDSASYYQQNNGFHIWATAASGTAGNAISFTQAMTLDASGNLVIGDTSTSSGLTLVRSGGTTAELKLNQTGTGGRDYRIGSTGSGYGTAGQLIFYDATASAERARISSDGTFRVKGAGTAGTTDAVQFSGSAPASAMTLDASGNLGVGTTTLNVGSYSKSITVAATAGAYGGVEISGTTGGALEFQTSQSTRQVQLLGNSSGFIINVNGGSGLAERARITSGGYFKASNAGTYQDAGGTYHELRSSASDVNTVFVANTSASPYGQVIKFSSASPDNNTNWFFTCEDSTTTRLYIYSDGDLANHDGVYGTISDQKLKQDIVDAGSQWADIKAIRFRKYRMKTDVAANPDAPALLGVVAQELEQVSPGLVDEHPDMETVEVTDEDGNVTQTQQPTGTTTKTVKSSILLMKAAVALQEAMARIEQLEAKVAALQGA